MISTTQPNRVRSISIAVPASLAIIGALGFFGQASGARSDGGRDRTGETRGQWVPDVQKEWERYGGKDFQPVPADRPHGTLVFRDVADRTGVGAFDIWVLVDGQRVKDWTASSPLRVAPGAHCIRIDMVSIPQRFEARLGKYWPWLREEWEHDIQLTRTSNGGFRIDYQPSKLSTKGLIDAEEIKFSGNRPSDPEAAYAYCLSYVNERR